MFRDYFAVQTCHKVDSLYIYMEVLTLESTTALLQTVFAIGAVHAHVMHSDWVGDARDHLLYFARSRLLCTHAGLLSESVSMGQVQLLGLAAVYLISTDQVNRYVLSATAGR